MADCRLAPRVDVSDAYEVVEDCAPLMHDPDDPDQASGVCCEPKRRYRSHCTNCNCGHVLMDSGFH